MADRYNTAWRELATALYAPPAEGKIYGTLDLDVGEALRFLEARRAEGVPLTITHLMVAALGRALAEDVPELNCFVRRGRVVPRSRVDVALAAQSAAGQGVGVIRVRDAHRLGLAEIAERVRGEAGRHRAGDESRINRSRHALRRIPWPLRRPAVRALSWCVNELGLEVRSLGVSGDVFGSILLSNLGTFGLGTAMLALFPAARLPAAVAMGRVEERAVVRGGEIVIRPVLPVTGTFDHRLVDGEQAGKLAASVARSLAKPELLDRAR